MVPIESNANITAKPYIDIILMYRASGLALTTSTMPKMERSKSNVFSRLIFCMKESFIKGTIGIAYKLSNDFKKLLAVESRK